MGLGIISDLFGSSSSKKMKKALAMQKNLINAMINTGNPLFKKMLAEQKSAMSMDFANAIQELRTADRRYGLLNPERRDEAVSQAFGQFGEDLGQRAGEQVRNYLAMASGANQNMLGLLGPLAELQKNRQAGLLSGGLEAAILGGESLFGEKPLGGSSSWIADLFGAKKPAWPITYTSGYV